MSPPASASQRVRPPSTARVVAYALATMSKTSRASGLLKRNISTATGVMARIAADSSAAAGEHQRRTVAYRSATAATPSSACGTSMLQLEKPKIRPESSITHNDALDRGGVEVVREATAAEAPEVEDGRQHEQPE